MNNFLEVPMPPAIARLKRDKRGYPIPAGVVIRPDGTPDFATIDMQKWLDFWKFRRCGICGVIMHGRVWFVGGPACAVNRLFFDHPMHEECARYALQVCPFLAIPAMHYRKMTPVHGGMLVTTIKSSSDEKPPVNMLGKTRKYVLTKNGNDLLLHALPWESLTWWKAGKELTAEENKIAGH